MSKKLSQLEAGNNPVSRASTLPKDIEAIRNEITRFFSTKDTSGRSIGSAKHGVYAFYDYEEEPIYVGQTFEKLSVRIRRHLTNWRTDAVAMNVLDPLEVAYIEVWPLDDLVENLAKEAMKAVLARAEYTVFEKVLKESTLAAVLNEKSIAPQDEITLPISYKQRIIPDSIYARLGHPDIRIARRATTIASLARVISERHVSPGLRRTLVIQARRLESLASQRAEDLGVPPDFE